MSNNTIKYNNSLFSYSRITTKTVAIGTVKVGSEFPIRVQSMTTTDTMDTENSIKQVKTLVDAGCEIVRFTAPNKKQAANLKVIKDRMEEQNIFVPLVADIHFTPNAAEVAADIVEKIRVNPGNYADKKQFEHIEYTEETYQQELIRIREKFTPLVLKCKANKVAMRIGTNHGSLSDRILSKYGDTPKGMVASAIEFIEICESLEYYDLVVSMKSSNPKVMIHAYRLLMHEMMTRGQIYPLHLGVTEAGEGEDGRIKSAVGIGTLLEDGIGDTIRVSLTEAPEAEIPVAKKIVSRYIDRQGARIPIVDCPINPFEYTKRETIQIENIGGSAVPVVLADFSNKEVVIPANLFAIGYNYSVKLDKWSISDSACDFIYLGKNDLNFNLPGTLQIIQDFSAWNGEENYPLFSCDEFLSKGQKHEKLNFVSVTIDDFNSEFFREIKNDNSVVLILNSNNKNSMAEKRAAIFLLMEKGITVPVVLKNSFHGKDTETFMLDSSINTGGLLIDGLGDGIFLEAQNIPIKTANDTAFGILQATRTRISKTDYISCPSCGRTLFDLQETTAKIRKKTNHLKGLKIGIMGCIVNGPGEMADADYGYVGTGKGKITLYKEKTVVKKNVPEADAVDELVNLIKDYGDWVESSLDSF